MFVEIEAGSTDSLKLIFDESCFMAAEYKKELDIGVYFVSAAVAVESFTEKVSDVNSFRPLISSTGLGSELIKFMSFIEVDF